LHKPAGGGSITACGVLAIEVASIGVREVRRRSALRRYCYKVFWDDKRKFLEPLMRFTRGDVRDHRLVITFRVYGFHIDCKNGFNVAQGRI
jgi:hypothetical protein